MRRRTAFFGIVVVLLVVAAGLPACGGDAGDTGATASPDPFVGTWRDVADSGANRVIVAKAQDGYLVTIALPSANGTREFERQGDKLLGTFGADELRVEIAYVPTSGRLIWANSRTPDGPLSAPTELVKVSDSTELPTPSPF